jgi:hypothetical protein
MSKKPVVFKPTLHSPQGINNFSGKAFRCFTKGETLGFRFTLKTPDGVPADIADWKVYIVMANEFVKDSGCTDDQQSIEIEIPLVDAALGIFEGEVTNFDTQDLPAGLNHALAKFITAPDLIAGTPGNTYIIDMCTLEVYPNLTFPNL